MRVLVSVSAIGVLVTSAAIALGAALRTLRALAAMGGLPPPLMRRSRRCERRALGDRAAGRALSGALMLAVSLLGREVDALASVYSFGILIAFMLVFASVVALRVREPSLPRAVRMGGSVRFGSSDIPVLALLGLAMSWALWVLDLGTHRAGRILPPVWLACRAGAVRGHAARCRASRCWSASTTVAPPPLEVIDLRFGTIVVPLKACGPIEEEMLAIACKLAQEQEGERVLGVQRRRGAAQPPAGRADPGRRPSAQASLLQLTAMFSRDYGVPVDFMAAAQPRDQQRGRPRRARGRRRADPGRRRAAHRRAAPGAAQVFSETIENLLRRAHCRVIVTSFPPGTASVAAAEESEPDVRIQPGPAPVALIASGAGRRGDGRRPAQQPRAEHDRDEQRRDAHADVQRAQPTTCASRLAPVAPAVIEAIAIARPVMPTRACRCAGAWRWRSPIAVVKLTHCARLSTIQIASTSQNAVETASASTASAADRRCPRRSPSARAVRPSSQMITRPGRDADQRADAEHPADVLAVELDDVAQERHDERLGAVEREVPRTASRA